MPRPAGAAVQNRATVQSQYTSLPSDALREVPARGGQIAVHDLESRVEGRPGTRATATWQDTERTYSLMNYFSNSLGVNCVFCHNSRAFYDVLQNTPQWADAPARHRHGAGDQQRLDRCRCRDEFPPERLGPVHGDVAKAACATCHKGYQKPMRARHGDGLARTRHDRRAGLRVMMRAAAIHRPLPGVSGR
jgi:photosynthetic reaction center cytochrome c subunit